MEEITTTKARSRASRKRAAALALVAVLAVVRVGLAQQGGGDEPAVGDTAEYEVLRRLLGVAPPSEKPAAEAPAAEPAVEAAPPPEAPAPETAKQPEKTGKAKPAPVAKKPAPVKKTIVKTKPKSSAKKPVAAAPKPKVEAAPAAPAAAPAPAQPEVVAAAAADDVEEVDVPSVGTVIAAADMEQWKHLMGPSVQWMLLRGAKVRVGETKPIPMEEARAQATQRYSAQVELTPDRRDMRNFVAGMPFPLVTSDDPDAGVKIIFNQQSRMIVDDVDTRKMGCHLATITDRGLDLERTFQLEHWRRLYYVGRLYHQPAPTWKNQEDIRYRELQYPLIEPFDLKGGGWNYIRYNSVERPDDGWLYYPVQKRVRRISTAQRSQGFFGQDMDLDSYNGYGGNPAWMQWRLVGEKVMLGAMHSEHVPVKWQAPPADFAADEPWEVREMYVVEGRSLLKEYAFARRVIYVDKESWLVPYSEIYDHQGKLWKALHQTWGFGNKVREDAGGRTFEEFYLPGYAMIDMQIDHITRCELPLSTAVGDKGWYYNYGEREGTTETAFDMVGMMGETR